MRYFMKKLGKFTFVLLFIEHLSNIFAIKMGITISCFYGRFTKIILVMERERENEWFNMSIDRCSCINSVLPFLTCSTASPRERAKIAPFSPFSVTMNVHQINNNKKTFYQLRVNYLILPKLENVA